MTRANITPMEVTVVFREKMVRICELMHMILFSQLSRTESHHYGAIVCEAVLIFDDMT